MSLINKRQSAWWQKILLRVPYSLIITWQVNIYYCTRSWSMRQKCGCHLHIGGEWDQVSSVDIFTDFMLLFRAPPKSTEEPPCKYSSFTEHRWRPWPYTGGPYKLQNFLVSFEKLQCCQKFPQSGMLKHEQVRPLLLILTHPSTPCVTPDGLKWVFEGPYARLNSELVHKCTLVYMAATFLTKVEHKSF